MGQPFLNSIALLFLSVGLSFLAAAFWYLKNKAERAKEKLAEEHGKLEDRMREMETQMGKVNQAVTPISAAFQAILIKELTHFHTPEMDVLLQKLGPPVTLTDEEELRLAELLRERESDLNGRISDQERDAAIMLPLVIKRVRVENETLAKTPKVELQIVAAVTDATAAPDLAPPSVAATVAADAVADKKQEEGEKP